MGSELRGNGGSIDGWEAGVNSPEWFTCKRSGRLGTRDKRTRAGGLCTQLE